MSIKILMNNKKQFKVEGTLEEWTEKIKSQQILEITPQIYIVSQNISELYSNEIAQKETTKKKSKKK